MHDVLRPREFTLPREAGTRWTDEQRQKIVEQLRVMDAEATAEHDVALAAVDAGRHFRVSRARLPREMRPMTELLSNVEVAVQRAVVAAAPTGDLPELRRVIDDLGHRSEAGFETSLLLAMLRRIAAALVWARMRPVFTLLLTLVRLLAEASRRDWSEPPDLPMPQQTRPARLSRCPHGPDLLAVDRTRHPAGPVTALRVA